MVDTLYDTLCMYVPSVVANVKGVYPLSAEQLHYLE